jgi:type IV fimbrial biogenesis protein FimT
MAKAGSRNGRGFSLIELMVSLGLVLLVAGWAVPSLHDFQQGIRAATASRQFHGLLESTRYRSLALAAPTTICATAADTVTCSRDHGGGLVVFEDIDEDGVVDSGEKVVVREMLADNEEFWLVWRAFQNRPYLRWAAGRTDSMNGTFTLCNRQRQDRWLRQLVVNRTGRTRPVEPARSTASVLQSARQACGW